MLKRPKPSLEHADPRLLPVVMTGAARPVVIAAKLPGVRATVSSPGEDPASYEKTAAILETLSPTLDYPEFLTLPLHETME